MLETVMNMKQRNRDVTINEKLVVSSKIPNERILRFALNLGMISRENYDCMKAVGKTKQVGELMKELSITSLDAFTGMLRKMV
jgi:Zn-dependent peptidase ImmA (M78 family)